MRVFSNVMSWSNEDTRIDPLIRQFLFIFLPPIEHVIIVNA